MLSPLHFVRLHWRVVSAVALLAVLVWACLPAPIRTKLASAWMKFGHFIGNLNARIILSLLYATVIALFGIPIRFFADSLNMKKPPVKWLDHPPVANDLEQARHQG